MANDMKVYDPDQISLSVAGIPIEKGLADGEFVRVEQESDDFEDVVGTDGEVTRSKSNDRRATVTILLMQSSEANDLLSALSNKDRNSPNGAGVGPFLMRDRSGRTLHAAEKSWVRRPPDVSMDRTATAREWTIRVADLQRTDGGN